MLLRAACAGGCLLLGAAVGVQSVGVHSWWWGLLLALAATVATLFAVPGGWWRRLPFALGWSGAVAVLSSERPEGDYLVATNGPGYTLLVATIVVMLLGLVGVRHRDPSAPRAAAAADDSGEVPPET